MKLNGKDYPIPQIKSFRDTVALESKGVKILALTEGSFFDKECLATSVVRGISYYTGLPFEQALDEVTEHIDNGGSIDDVLNSLMQDIASMIKTGETEGFSKAVQKKVPQDHRKKQNK